MTDPRIDALTAADAVDPLRRPGMVTVDTNDEALAASIKALSNMLDQPNAGGRIGVGTAYDISVVLAALAGQGERL